MTRARMMIQVALAVFSLAAAISSAMAEPQTVVFLVRHAEKEADGADPGLSGAGIERADLLADMLADAGVTALYSSEYKRAEQTAAPLAKRLRIQNSIVKAGDPDGLLGKVRALAPGSRAVIVGHSNTVPALAERLTGRRIDMAETDYDRLYVATLRSDGQGELVVLHYGPAARPTTSK